VRSHAKAASAGSISGTGIRRSLLLALLTALALAFTASSASAAKTRVYETSFGPDGTSGTTFGSAAGVAVDQQSKDIYVADTSNGTIYKFDENHQPANFSALGTNQITGISFRGGSGESQIAVDSTSHRIYATSANSVLAFQANGEPATFSALGSNEITGFGELLGVGVDANGAIYASDYPGENGVHVYAPSGQALAQFATSHAANVAADSAGAVYIHHYNGATEKFIPSAFPVTASITYTSAGIVDPNATYSLAVNPTSDDLYVDHGTSIVQRQSDGTAIGTFANSGPGALSSSTGIAVKGTGASERIYVSDTGGQHRVEIFGPAVTVPDVKTEAATAVTTAGATLHGTIGAVGSPASCEFQYTTQASFEAEGFEGATAVPCSPTGPITGVAEPVSATLSGLVPETLYLFRLVGTNANGPNFSEALYFNTVGLPQINSTFALPIGIDSATLQGLVNPNGGPNAAEPTTYVIEYVSQADYVVSEYTNAITVPAGGEAIGSGIEDVKVAQQVTGLSPGSTYHFRIVAENEAGTKQGPDTVFTTYVEQAAGLPDGRAYEQATPVDKGGSSAQGPANYVKAASGGGGITFFSNGGIPGIEGSQQFPTYLAIRDADGSGWATQGTLPPASNGSSALLRAYNEDLSQTYVTQSKIPAENGALYQRDSATHALRSIGGGVEVGSILNTYAGESADGSKVLVELTYGPVAPPHAAPESQNTFVWDQATATLTVAGVLNNGEAPAGGTSPGSYVFPSGPNNYTLYERPISSDGSRVYFTALASHQLYLRLNPTQPQSLMAGGECTEPTRACTVQVSEPEEGVSDPNGLQPATLAFATPDGSQAFFMSPGRLTADATTGPEDKGRDLYRYDVASGDLTDLTIDNAATNGADVQGVLGISDDGSYVYFVANGVLSATPNSEGQSATLGDCRNEINENYVEYTEGVCNLYLWHNGVVTYIAPQSSTPQSKDAFNWLRKPVGFTPGKTARVTPDGHALLFRSWLKLTSYDNEDLFEFYRYGAEENELLCVTCNPTGVTFKPLGEREYDSPTLQSLGFGAAGVDPGPIQTRNLSADGSRIIFETPDKLVGNDLNGDDSCPLVRNGFSGSASCKDVYEWEAKGTGSCRSDTQNGGCLYLLSTGNSPGPSYFGDASLNGEDAFIFTLQALVGQDQDQLVDIYDARVGGGIAAQNPLPPPSPCEGEACKGAAGVPPVTPSSGSSSFSGPGNPKPPHHHKKKKKRHGKKKHHKKRHATRKHG
jgi:hypothetical protein